MLISSPTPEQQKAIDASGNIVIIAKPGSGKTFVLAEKIRDKLLKVKSFQGIIAISYTNKASAELRNRCTSHGIDLKESFFGTIDNFCFSEIIYPFLHQLWGRPSLKPQIIKINQLPENQQEVFSDIRFRVISVDDLKKNIKMIQLQFFNGKLLLECSGSLALYVISNSIACKRYLKTKYNAIYVDEYQDSGIEQHELFLTLARLGLNATAVGDADQSIFAFSGKKPDYLLSLPREPSFSLFTIDLNHRCHPSIINYSIHLLNQDSNLMPAPALQMYYKNCGGTQNEIAAWIDRSLPRLLSSFKVEKKCQIGVLVRNFITGNLIDECLRAPHKYFFSTDLDSDSSLWGMLFKALLSYRFNSAVSAEEIIESNIPAINKGSERKLKVQIKQLRQLSIDDLYNHFVAIANSIYPRSRSSESLTSLAETLQSNQMLSNYMPPDDNCIQIMSIHKSKGLEFDVVLHLDLYEWVFPSKRPGANNDWDNPIYPDYAQELNLHYVAITRARKACFLISSSQRLNKDAQIKSGRPSEFLNLGKLAKMRITIR